MGRVVAAYAYAHGRRVAEIQLGESASWTKEPGSFVWIGFFAPDESDLRTLQAQFGLHELAVEDALHAHQLPKVEIYGDSLFLVLRTAALAEGQVLFGETHLFVGEDYLITVRHGASQSYLPVRQRLEASPRLLEHGVDYVLHAVLDFVVDNYFPVVRSLATEVERIEDQIFGRTLARTSIDQIYKLRRELARLRQVVTPVADVCSRLMHAELPCLDAEVRPYFGDVLDHVRRVQEAIDGLRETLGFAFEAALLLEARQHSDVSRRFAAWAAILAVPTAIAGIYGMNFEHMPELAWSLGYPLVLGLIALICVLLYARFRRAGWL